MGFDYGPLETLPKVVWPPAWERLRNGDGLHLIFGSCCSNGDGWEVVDKPFDLVRDDYPWEDVDAIHCCSMLYQWDYVDSIRVLDKSYAILSPGGVMWLGEDHRNVNGESVFSLYTAESLARILTRVGFEAVIRGDPLDICGRKTGGRFALRAMK